MPAVSGSFGKLLEPGLRKIFFESYGEKPEQYSKYTNVQSSKKAVETDYRMGGFHMWEKKGTLDATEYEDPTDTLPIYYKHETFSKGFQVEKELSDDEQYNQIKKFPKALGRAARATIETHAASMLNNAFTASATNPYGEALIANNHARLDKGVALTNHIGQLALNEPNLEIALKLAREQQDETGLKIQMVPKTLVVPGALEYTAKKILKSSQVPIAGGATQNASANDYNPYQGMMKLVVLDYLTDPKAWFLIDDSMNPLNFFWRERLNFKGSNDFDTDIAKYKGRMRYSYGWSDWRGVLGSNPS